MTKDEQRNQAKLSRKQITKEENQKKSHLICQAILQSKYYKNASKVLSYASFGTEVDTQELNRQVLLDNKKLFLPKTDLESHSITFYEVTDIDQLLPGYQGILEPPIHIPFQSNQKALMVLPGLAYDHNKMRMGYGGGYYDRYLQDKAENYIKLMAAFSSQRLEYLITEDNDVKMDFIITEKSIV